jgi:lysyl-tRNA synthetase class 2
MIICDTGCIRLALTGGTRLLESRFGPAVREGAASFLHNASLRRRRVGARQRIAVKSFVRFVVLVLMARMIGVGGIKSCAAQLPPGHAVPAVKRTEVSSSAIVRVGYDDRQRMLEVEFHDGTIYLFLNVPASRHKGLLRAKSKGRYFNKHIMRRYDYRRVRGAR